MTIETRSKFYYGHTVNEANLYINFDDGSGEVTAQLRAGSYSLTDYVTEVARAMNEVGGQEYTVTVDRSTRLITISASANFSILFLSGTNSSQSAIDLHWGLMQ
jgi:hypothetical protein